MDEYPKWRDHPTLGRILVEDADREAVLFPEPTPEPKPRVVSKPETPQRVKHK